MIDKRSQADRLLVAELYGEARHHARWRELSSDEEAAAVAALRELAGGRADLLAEREARYKQDRESWRARIAQYAAARARPASARDGWLSLVDGDEYDEMCRWPVLSDDFVREPPSAEARETA